MHFLANANFHCCKYCVNFTHYKLRCNNNIKHYRFLYEYTAWTLLTEQPCFTSFFTISRSKVTSWPIRSLTLYTTYINVSSSSLDKIEFIANARLLNSVEHIRILLHFIIHSNQDINNSVWRCYCGNCHYYSKYIYSYIALIN